jgi:hypothetical protein
MSDKKISQLTALAASGVAPSTDVMAVVDTNVTETKKITVKDVVDGALNTQSANGVVYLNGSKEATAGSVVTYDGTTFKVDGAVTINDSGADVDFRVEGDTDANLLFVDASTDRVGVGTNAPEGKLHILASSAGTVTAPSDFPLVLEGTTIAGISLLSSNAGEGRLWFGDPDDNDVGRIEYAHGTNAMTFRTNGTDRAVIDSSGNLGLGVTPSAWESSWKAFQLFGNGSLSGISGLNAVYLSSNVYKLNDQSSKYIASDLATQYQQYNGEHRWYTAPSGTAGNTITFTQAMTLNASGNLGIGTTTPGARLDVTNTGGTSDKGIHLQTFSGGNIGTFWTTLNDLYIGITGAHVFTNFDGSVERARITSGGDLLVGTTSTFSLSSGSATGSFILAGGAYVASRDDNLIGLRRTNSNGNVAEFYRSTTSVGSISVTTTATAFNTSSDRRLKENIAPAEDAGEIIDAIEIVKHDWKAGGHTRYGAIAQDLYSVAPEAVLAGDDGEEVEKTWGVDYSKLVPMLVKEIQSLRARVAALEGAN